MPERGINSFWSIIIWQFIRLMRLKNSLYHYGTIPGKKYVKIGLASCKLLWYNNTAVCGSISSEDENKNLYTTFL